MLDWLIIGLVGFWAGMINSVVGSGTLVTFPTLVWLGVPPITANVSNNLGLVPGAITGFLGTKDQIGAGRAVLKRMMMFSAAGGFAGALLLILLPEAVFTGVVPIFILLGVALVLLAPRIQRQNRVAIPTAVVFIGVLITGLYGGYFGAAQGVILLGILNAVAGLELFEANAVKNALIAVVNGVASIVFLTSGAIDWGIVVAIAFTSTLGAWIGARYGRRLPLGLYRAIIATIGMIAVAWFVLS